MIDGDAAAMTEVVLYQTEDGATRVQLRMHEGTVWVTQRQLAELYQVAKSSVSTYARSTRSASCCPNEL